MAKPKTLVDLGVLLNTVLCQEGKKPVKATPVGVPGIISICIESTETHNVLDSLREIQNVIKLLNKEARANGIKQYSSADAYVLGSITKGVNFPVRMIEPDNDKEYRIYTCAVQYYQMRK